MANTRIETQLSIKAVDEYSGVLKGMQNVTGRFADEVRNSLSGLVKQRGSLKLIDDFKEAQAKADRAREAFERQKEEVRRLRGEMKKAEAPTEQMTRAFEQARAKAERLRQAHERQVTGLRDLGGRLREAGVDTSDLGADQRRLTTAIGNATTAMDRQIERMQRMERLQTRLTDARKRRDDTLGVAANLSFVGDASINTGRRILTGVSAPVRQAVEFETAMSDVKKVVDFDTPDGFRQMSDDILELSTRIPMTAEGLAQIVAAGGQSGVARADLTRFAEMAAKIGVAFDISADQSGDAMANIKTALSLTLEETGLIFDAMNHLSNNMASTAPDVLDFTNRVAVDGVVKGFSPTETMAFGSAMIAAGAGADVAATSFRNMGKALARGDGATARQADAFKALGLNAGTIAKAMQEDAVGTTLDVMERINTLPKHLQSSVVSDLFGDEARALAPLINNLDLLRSALGLVEEEKAFQGSADREYAARAETTANNLQLLQNRMTRLGISVGEVVLPPLNELLGTVGPIIDRVTTWAKEHPKLTKTLVVGAVAVGSLAVAGGALLTAAAGLIGTLAVLRFGMVGLGARAAFALGEVVGVGGAFRGLTSMVSTLLPNFGPALGKFAGFRRDASAEMTALSTHVSSQTALINRNLSKIRWKAFGTGVMTYLSLQKIPDDPAERKTFQDDNARKLDGWFRSAPGIRNLVSGYERAFEWVHGRQAPVYEGLLPDDAGVRAAAGVVQSAAGSGNLPTAERLSRLREDVAAFRAEVEAATALVAANPDFAGGMTNPLRVQAQAELDAAEAGLQRALEDLRSAETASAQLSEALRVLAGTDVAPEINTASIDRALEKVRQLANGLQGLPSGGAGGAPSPAGARASGGPVRTGLPYLVNENTARSEWFVPSRSGGILNVGQAQRVFQSHLGDVAGLQRGAQAVRAAGLAVLASSTLAAPVAAQGGAGALSGGVRVEINGGVNIHVPAGVSDPQAVAEFAADEIGRRVAATLQASFSD